MAKFLLMEWPSFVEIHVDHQRWLKNQPPELVYPYVRDHARSMLESAKYLRGTLGGNKYLGLVIAFFCSLVLLCLTFYAAFQGNLFGFVTSAILFAGQVWVNREIYRLWTYSKGECLTLLAMAKEAKKTSNLLRELFWEGGKKNASGA